MTIRRVIYSITLTLNNNIFKNYRYYLSIHKILLLISFDNIIKINI